MLTRVPTNTIAIPKALTLCVKIRRAGLNCLRRPLCYSSFRRFSAHLGQRRKTRSQNHTAPPTSCVSDGTVDESYSVAIHYTSD